MFNGISTFVGHLIPNPSLSKISGGTIQIIAEGLSGVIPLPGVDALDRLEFEIVNYDIAVLHLTLYTMRTPLALY